MKTKSQKESKVKSIKYSCSITKTDCSPCLKYLFGKTEITDDFLYFYVSINSDSFYFNSYDNVLPVTNKK